MVFFSQQRSWPVIQQVLRLLKCIVLTLSASAAAENPPLLMMEEPRPAPDKTYSDTQGNPHAIADYTGKVVVVNFWATWCPPCVLEMPSLQRLSELSENIQVLGINMFEDAETVTQFVVEHDVRFLQLLDPETASPPLWLVRVVPTTFVIDPTGNIVAIEEGDREWDNEIIVEQLHELLQ